MQDDYEKFIALVKRVSALGDAGGVLMWDQEVVMPPGAAQIRAQEMAVLSGVVHEMFTSKEMGELLERLRHAELPKGPAANVREIAWSYDRATRVSQKLVEEMSAAASNGMEVWKRAKPANDYAAFMPALEKNIILAREYAKLVEPDADAYEALLHGYEKDLSIDEVRAHLQKIRETVVPLLQKIAQQPRPHTEMLKVPIPQEKQRAEQERLLKMCGYDFTKGRLDISAHPFSGCYGRITTRYTDGWFSTILHTMHEMGHGMYEHNLPFEHYGTPLGSSASLSIHESQSRFWENHICLAEPFWRHAYLDVRETYKPALDHVPLQQFMKAINAVTPGPIRIEADELTYVLHIILRFELEQELIAGTLNVADLPAVWNAKMQELLGITPKNDAEGCMQDMHWADGNFGYFPTYVLGSMISAQLYAAAKAAIPKLEEKIAAGDFAPIRKWLIDNIHRHGSKYTTKELVRKATGKDPSPDDYLQYLTEKFSKIYALS